MTKIRIKWTKELANIESIKYNTRTEFQKKSVNAYSAALRNGWLDEICGHMKLLRNNNWTFEDMKKIANKYVLFSDFKKNENAVYLYAQRRGYLDKLTSHMNRTYVRWDKNKLHNEALKYDSRTEFEQNNPNAYNSALRWKIMDEITTHMIPLGHRYKRMIYVYEFSDNFCYIGLTFNKKKRNYSHMTSKTSAVYQHIEKTGLIPICKSLTDYIDNKEAQKKESDFLEKYIQEGWFTLNKTKTGNLGSSQKKWTKDKIWEIAKKYDSLHDFRENDVNAWNAAYKSEWYEEMTSHMSRIIKVRKYTKEIVIDIVKKYTNFTDFMKNENSVYNVVLKNGWKDLLSDLERNIIVDYTNKDLVSVSKKYKTKTEFKNNSPGEYLFAQRKGLLNSITEHMVDGRIKWTKNDVYEIAKKFDNLTKFRKENKNAHDAAQKYGWLCDVTKHMTKRRVWDFESVKQEALKYQNRDAFRLGSMGAYSYAKKNNVLDEITLHMIFKNVKGHKKTIKICELCGKKIGGVGNFKKHMKISHNIEV
jgi:predicted GIY-YIG superfamily endonuclease